MIQKILEEWILIRGQKSIWSGGEEKGGEFITGRLNIIG